LHKITKLVVTIIAGVLLLVSGYVVVTSGIIFNDLYSNRIKFDSVSSGYAILAFIQLMSTIGLFCNILSSFLLVMINKKFQVHGRRKAIILCGLIVFIILTSTIYLVSYILIAKYDLIDHIRDFDLINYLTGLSIGVVIANLILATSKPSKEDMESSTSKVEIKPAVKKLRLIVTIIAGVLLLIIGYFVVNSVMSLIKIHLNQNSYGELYFKNEDLGWSQLYVMIALFCNVIPYWLLVVFFKRISDLSEFSMAMLYAQILSLPILSAAYIAIYIANTKINLADRVSSFDFTNLLAYISIILMFHNIIDSHRRPAKVDTKIKPSEVETQ
jgi:hypothetical protein